MTAVGVSNLAKRLGTNRSTVQRWKVSSEDACRPRISQAFGCIALSMAGMPCGDGKPLTLDDIYGNVEELLTAEAEHKAEAKQ